MRRCKRPPNRRVVSDACRRQRTQQVMVRQRPVCGQRFWASVLRLLPVILLQRLVLSVACLLQRASARMEATAAAAVGAPVRLRLLTLRQLPPRNRVRVAAAVHHQPTLTRGPRRYRRLGMKQHSHAWRLPALPPCHRLLRAPTFPRSWKPLLSLPRALPVHARPAAPPRRCPLLLLLLRLSAHPRQRAHPHLLAHLHLLARPRLRPLLCLLVVLPLLAALPLHERSRLRELLRLLGLPRLPEHPRLPACPPGYHLRSPQPPQASRLLLLRRLQQSSPPAPLPQAQPCVLRRLFMPSRNTKRHKEWPLLPTPPLAVAPAPLPCLPSPHLHVAQSPSMPTRTSTAACSTCRRTSRFWRSWRTSRTGDLLPRMLWLICGGCPSSRVRLQAEAMMERQVPPGPSASGIGRAAAASRPRRSWLRRQS